MKNWPNTVQAIILSSVALTASQFSLAQSLSSNEVTPVAQTLSLGVQTSSNNESDLTESTNAEQPKIDIEESNPTNLDESIDSNENQPTKPKESEEIEMSPWSASMFYLYNFNNNKQLIVPTPGYEKGGFKANAQSASYKFEKLKGFESQVSTNWSIGQNDNFEEKLIFKANASVKRRVVVAVPFVEVSQGISLKTNYSQVSVGASSFIPTPWFFILPKYTATYSNQEMNQFDHGVAKAGWASGWGVTLLKPINKNWTFLAIYSGKKLEEKLRVDDESKQSLMMILSYQFDKDFIEKFKK